MYKKPGNAARPLLAAILLAHVVFFGLGFGLGLAGAQGVALGLHAATSVSGLELTIAHRGGCPTRTSVKRPNPTRRGLSVVRHKSKSRLHISGLYVRPDT